MKLVRDKIPDIIKENGKKCKYHVADHSEYKASLYEKMREELDEFIDTPCYEEAADIYEKNNRSELMENEMEELKILSLYLPKMMSEDELRALIESIISETGAKNMSDMGKVMPEIMKRSAGKADGKMAQQIVSKLLQ